MNNESQNELLSAYLDGELTADERAQVERLLATNPGARQLLEELRALSAALKSLPRQTLGEDLSDSVLRIAERRTLSKSPDKMGTGAVPEPVPIVSPVPVYSEPLSKTIFRRLKNPRIWIWQIVIVAVAILLLVYNPNQNLNKNAAMPGNAERSIAMASKPGDKEASSEPTSIRAAPPPDTDNLKSRDELIVPQKQLDTSGRSGVALADKQPVAPTAPADKQPMAPVPLVENRPVSAGLEKAAKDESAAIPERPARSRAALAKTDSMQFGDKPAADDVRKEAFKSAAKGYASAAESAATPSATPAAGFTAQDQPQQQPGGTQAAKTMNENFSLSQNKPAEPPAESESAEQFKAKAEFTDELLVVRCEITPEALNNHAFDKLLADNAIVWSETPQENMLGENLPKAETIRSLSGKKADQTTSEPEGLDRAKGVRGIIEPSKTQTLEIVYVEASPAQIEATLNGLSAQNGMFKKVSIAPEKEGRQLQQFIAGDNRRQDINKAVQAMPGKAGLSKETAEDQYLFAPNIPSSTATNVVLGRAQRVPSSLGYEAKSVVETKDQKHNANLPAQKALPKATGYGGISDRQSGGSVQGARLGVADGAGSSTGGDAAEQSRQTAQSLNQSEAAKSDQRPASVMAAPSATQAPMRAAKQEEYSQKAQNRQDSDSPRGDFGITQSGSASVPRMQRVLFVMQVTEQGNNSDNAKQSAPADTSNADVVPADAIPANSIPGKK
jgi:hypothetical protein